MFEWQWKAAKKERNNVEKYWKTFYFLLCLQKNLNERPITNFSTIFQKHFSPVGILLLIFFSSFFGGNNVHIYYQHPCKRKEMSSRRIICIKMTYYMGCKYTYIYRAYRRKVFFSFPYR